MMKTIGGTGAVDHQPENANEKVVKEEQKEEQDIEMGYMNGKTAGASLIVSPNTNNP